MDVPSAAALLGGWDRFLILTHKRPDGDTIGCAVGLCALLRQVGKTAWILPNPDVTALFAPYLEGYTAPEGYVPERVVSVDVASLGLLPDNARRYGEQIDLAIDHHPSNEGFARHNCVEADKAACGEIIFKLVSELGTLDREIATALYLAVSTDTGCFVYSNTTPNTHRVAAALMELDIPYRAINKRHFRTKSFKRLKLESMLTESMELYDGGETAVAAVTLEMLNALKATEEDTDNITAFAGQTEGVKNAVTLREYPGGEFRVSLRTTGGLDASKVCGLLGGGGHAGAAGCTVHGSLEEARRAILAAIAAQMAQEAARTAGPGGEESHG